jgi:hypothetical protein
MELRNELLAVGLTLAQVDEISGTKQFKLYNSAL